MCASLLLNSSHWMNAHKTTLSVLPCERNHFCHSQVPSNPYAALAWWLSGLTDKCCAALSKSFLPASTPYVCYNLVNRLRASVLTAWTGFFVFRFYGLTLHTLQIVNNILDVIIVCNIIKEKKSVRILNVFIGLGLRDLPVFVYKLLYLCTDMIKVFGLWQFTLLI